MLDSFSLFRIVLLAIRPVHALFSIKSDSDDSTLVEAFEQISLRFTESDHHAALHCRASLMALSVKKDFDLCL